MKRKIAYFVSIVASFVVSVCMLTGCSFLSQSSSSGSAVLVPPEAMFLVEETTETCVVIKVNKAQDSQTVLDVMQALQAEGKMSYTLSGTMLQSINGKENPTDWSLQDGDIIEIDITNGRLNVELSDDEIKERIANAGFTYWSNI